MGEVGRTVSSVHQAASFAVPFAAMGTAVVAAMAAEGAAGLRRTAGIAESMVVGGAMVRPRIVQHVEESLMAALLHLDAGEGWTEHPPLHKTAMKLARFLLMCTESQRWTAWLPNLTDSTSSVQKSVARSVWPHHFASLRIVAACWLLRAGPRAHVGRPLMTQIEVVLRSQIDALIPRRK